MAAVLKPQSATTVPGGRPVSLVKRPTESTSLRCVGWVPALELVIDDPGAACTGPAPAASFIEGGQGRSSGFVQIPAGCRSRAREVCRTGELKSVFRVPGAEVHCCCAEWFVVSAG